MTLLTDMGQSIERAANLPDMQMKHEDRLVLSRLRWSHMVQSVERAMDDPEFAQIMCDPMKNPAPNLEDISPNRTLN